MSKTYTTERSGPHGVVTGCIVETKHPDGCTTVERRDAYEDFFGVHHGKVTDTVTYSPPHKG
jgi:hypothetical protein